MKNQNQSNQKTWIVENQLLQPLQKLTLTIRMGRKVAAITGAVSGDTYVKLDHGILTVNQIDMFLKAMPFELTYADDNNQFLYYNNAHQDPDTMFAKLYHLNQVAVCQLCMVLFHQHV